MSSFGTVAEQGSARLQNELDAFIHERPKRSVAMAIGRYFQTPQIINKLLGMINVKKRTIANRPEADEVQQMFCCSSVTIDGLD